MSSEYEEPATSRRHYCEDRNPTAVVWRTMLRCFSSGGEDDCLEEDARGFSRVVTTIALEEDAPGSFAAGW